MLQEGECLFLVNDNCQMNMARSKIKTRGLLCFDLCIILVNHALEDFMDQKIYFISNLFLCYFGPFLHTVAFRHLFM